MTGEKIYETIIIGAGPAGLTAGRYLEDALILDEKKEIGKPVQCGEGISTNTLKVQEIKPYNSWISCEIHKMERIVPNGKIIGKFHEEIMGYVIDREKFEKYLAQDAKAEIKLNTKVTDLKFKDNLWEVTTKNKEMFKAKYIIGADGPSSIVRRKIFSENKNKIEFIPAIEYLIKTEKELDGKTIKIYLDNKKYDHGYAWIFPKSKNTANIGICGKGKIIDQYNLFLEEITKKYGGYEFIENRSGSISIANSQFKIYKDGVFLTGDAAGLADPIFKGGMNQAMSSAKEAAKCILENRLDLYEPKIKSMPFADVNLIKANKIFYSFDNEVLDELGNVLEGKGFSYIKTLSGILKILSKPKLLKNIYKLFIFFSAIRSNKDFI